nr:hypothetical protein [Tanacetum cinerariifolium]
ELALLYPGMVTLEYKKVERYIWGLTEDIQGKVTSSRPTKIQESIRMAYNLMDQVVRAMVVKDADTKESGKMIKGKSLPTKNKRHKVVRVYATRTGNKTRYAGTLLLYDTCNLHHHRGPCLA